MLSTHTHTKKKRINFSEIMGKKISNIIILSINVILIVNTKKSEN